MPLSRNRPSGWLFIIFLILMIILAACTGTNNLGVGSESAAGSGEEIVIQPNVQVEGPEEPKILDSGQEESQPESQLSPTEMPVEGPTAEPDVPSENPTLEPAPEDEITPTQEKIFVASNRPLASTDPSDVSLASGQYQLVEFFAYW